MPARLKAANGEGARKRFAKEAKDSDKVNEEGDKANEGPSPKRKKLTAKRGVQLNMV